MLHVDRRCRIWANNHLGRSKWERQCGVCASVSLAFIILSIYIAGLFIFVQTIFFLFQIICMDLCMRVFVSRVFHHFYAIFRFFFGRSAYITTRHIRRLDTCVCVFDGKHMGPPPFVFVFLNIYLKYVGARRLFAETAVGAVTSSLPNFLAKPLHRPPPLTRQSLHMCIRRKKKY